MCQFPTYAPCVSVRFNLIPLASLLGLHIMPPGTPWVGARWKQSLALSPFEFCVMLLHNGGYNATFYAATAAD